ncbi:MAG: hypothetical protein K0M60_15235 [Hydrogenophaga sp.]|nr:hypothetical protein [Hydrogenophaga sp.]
MARTVTFRRLQTYARPLLRYVAPFPIMLAVTGQIMLRSAVLVGRDGGRPLRWR